jgi:sulfide dehydrogenase cytochrome subunit
MSVRKTLAVILGSGLLLGAAHVSATPPTASMLADTCAGCHGPDGSSVGPAIPSIAGMSAEYFNTTMGEYKAYKLDEEGNLEAGRYGTIMNRIAKGYTDEEIALMADFFAGKEFVRYAQNVDAEKVKAGAKLYDKNCEKCHEDNGASPGDDAGILAGQWLPYLNYSMVDFTSGRRDMPKKMKKKVEKLSADDIEALMHFFASQQ